LDVFTKQIPPNNKNELHILLPFSTLCESAFLTYEITKIKNKVYAQTNE